MKNKILKVALLSLGLLMVNVSCSDDFVERQFNQEVEQAPLTTIQELESFSRGMFNVMRDKTYYGCDFLAYGEVRSDEMYSNLASGYYVNVMNYTQISSDAYAKNTWTFIYRAVATANVVINTDISGFKASDKPSANFIQGQAYAVRALGFFDLLRLYGQKYTGAPTSLGVVLPLKYDPRAKQGRSTIAETEAQIEADFAKAEQLMTANNRTTSKTDLSVAALKGLMARYYLYKGDYAKVRDLVKYVVDLKAYEVVAASGLQDSYSFKMNGSATNSIFELAVGNTGSLSTDSYAYKINYDGYGNVVVNPEVLDLYNPGDVRLKFFTELEGDLYVSAGDKGKYLNITGSDNIKMLRFEEILLDGVEAELKGGNPATALEYYKQLVSNRWTEYKDDAGVTHTLAAQLALVTSVDMDMLKEERTRELIGEGLRQWDLRRWGDAVPRPAGASADPFLNAFPIPLSETNVGAVKGNQGYDNFQ
ncbi:RagB/SusD family nutrient uptake outer membrane protein [Chryseobacterium capnotolerans]|uniref:RagB/SusD family nutrient uptake outer membrane protein n=1 Tax=Chryseobacterium TaxID=59732 RepID=UPI00083A6A29|nr:MULTISPECIES: RagB/SusD family nutrient uptake outer membrane protein [Chryseobacterium]UHO37988.1 RagB/SusD family nutrient uptake outer membrane protein [Chryseobacterium capnotolerans]